MSEHRVLENLGAIHVTSAAETFLNAAGLSPDAFLLRHQRGDWEEDEPTRAESLFAARHGLRIVALFRLAEDESLRVHSRQDFVRAVETGGLVVEEVRDVPLGDAPADRLSPAGRAGFATQPLCLAIRARRVG